MASSRDFSPEPSRDSGRARQLWTQVTNLVFGLWLILVPLGLGYEHQVLMYSDIAAGIALLLFTSVTLLLPRQPWSSWSAALVGLWLMLAPLVFWSHDAGVYANDTVMGSLVIAFALLIPGLPGTMRSLGPQLPPGWSYNPSAWTQRGPIIVLATIGFLISHYLAMYQLGHLPVLVDPFFGDGTQRVLTSSISKMWPVSDAGLGAVGYMLIALMAYMGGQDRWRTMPWLVFLFAFFTIPMALVGIALVILQPIAVGTWCTLCLVTATACVLMIPLEADELAAALYHLRLEMRDGKSFWAVFWGEAEMEEVYFDRRTPAADAHPLKHAHAMFWGFSFIWNLCLAAALGVWLLFAPSLFAMGAGIANTYYGVGALTIVIAIASCGEILRPLRWALVPLGIWLLSTAVFGHSLSGAARAVSVVVGLAIAVLAARRGPILETYGDWGLRRRLISTATA